jgi:hypothetical protein
MLATAIRQQGCRDLLPNPPLQTEEAGVPPGRSTHRRAPSLPVALTISTGPRR